MLDVLAPVGKHIVPYTPEISVAFIACLLVVLGNDINRVLRKIMNGQHFVVRTVAFILLNAFGYGLLMIKATPYLSNWLRTFEPGLLLIVVLSSFTIIGMWAQKHRHV